MKVLDLTMRIYPIQRPALRALWALSVATSALMTSAAFAANPAPAFKADAAKGQQLAASCGACHTQDGSRGTPANPILAAQHPEYITKQLIEFKSGKRKNAIMAGMAAGLSEEDMKHIAAFYASTKVKPGFARDPKSVALGEQIYRGGIIAKAVPAVLWLPQPERRRHSRAVSAPGRPTRRVHRVAAAGLPLRCARQQRTDDGHLGQAERRRDQGRVRLPGRPALNPASGQDEHGLVAHTSPFFLRRL